MIRSVYGRGHNTFARYAVRYIFRTNMEELTKNLQKNHKI